MAHPGVLNTTIHKEGPPNALTAVCMKSFPITEVQAKAVEKRGDTVYDVSIGQGVVLRDGSSFFHGAEDGLHIDGDEVFV